MKDHATFRVLAFAAALGAACDQSQTAVSPTPSTPSPVSVTYSTSFGPQGSASRSFSVPQAGTVSATLLEAGPPSTVTLGLGLGIPRSDGAGCTLAISVITAAGPDAQVSSAVDAGSYCVKVFAAGGLTGEVAVTVTLVHP